MAQQCYVVTLLFIQHLVSPFPLVTLILGKRNIGPYSTRTKMTWCHILLYNNFLNLCFNLCSHKWLRTGCSFVINLIPLGLWLLKKNLAEDLINFRILFFKMLKLLEFLMLWSSLFRSITVDGKKQPFKKSRSCFKEKDIMQISSNINFLNGLVWIYNKNIRDVAQCFFLQFL